MTEHLLAQTSNLEDFESDAARVSRALLEGGTGSGDPGLYEKAEDIVALRQAQEAWLTRRGLDPKDPASVYDTTMTAAERDMFSSARTAGSVGSDEFVAFVGKIRENHDVPEGARRARVNVTPIDPGQPSYSRLVTLDPGDFWTRVDDDGQLESVGVEPNEVHDIAMGEREFLLLGHVGGDRGGVIAEAREIYGIAQGDQQVASYALVHEVSGNPDAPETQSRLMKLDDEHFGELVDPDTIAQDFEGIGPGPYNPTDLLGGKTREHDISSELNKAGRELREIAGILVRELGITADFLSKFDRSKIWIRAGGLLTDANGNVTQERAYVWKDGKALGSALDLLRLGYDSIAFVTGERVDAANGKTNMAQVVDPQIVVQIKNLGIDKWGGDRNYLQWLQEAHDELYHHPDFAVSEAQRKSRDAHFDTWLIDLIYHEAETQAASARARREAEEQSTYTAPPEQRARPLPGSQDHR